MPAEQSFFAKVVNDLVFVDGQSNARSIDIGTLPQAYIDASPYRDVWLFQGSEFTPLSNSGSYSYLDNPNAGVPFFLGHKMANVSNGKKVYIHMRSEGGASLGVSETSIDAWKVGEVNEQWDKKKADWAAAKLWAANTGKVFNPLGEIWIQGEQDCKSLAQANAYEANLNALFDAMIAEFGIKNFLIYRLHDKLPIGDFPQQAIVRAAQVAVAEARSDTEWIDTDGFEVGIDDIHFTATGQEQMSQAGFPHVQRWKLAA